jgi:hypothetical protein
VSCNGGRCTTEGFDLTTYRRHQVGHSAPDCYGCGLDCMPPGEDAANAVLDAVRADKLENIRSCRLHESEFLQESVAIGIELWRRALVSKA